MQNYIKKYVKVCLCIGVLMFSVSGFVVNATQVEEERATAIVEAIMEKAEAIEEVEEKIEENRFARKKEAKKTAVVVKKFEEEPEEAKFVFDFEDDKILEMVDYNELYVFRSEIKPSNLMNPEEVLDNIGGLEITSGLMKHKISSFAKTRTVTGKGEEGLLVGVKLFHIEEVMNEEEETSRNIVYTMDDSFEIGASGIFSDILQLTHIGENYVIFMVKNPENDFISKRMYKVIRKEEKTKDILENMIFDFSSSEIMEEEMKETELIKDIIQKNITSES